MKRYAAFAVLAMSALAATAFAADSKMAGKWTITGDVQGYPINESCTLAGPDDKLAGKCIGEMTVDATATFNGTVLTITHPGQYQGQPLTLTFTGKVQTDGTLAGGIDVQPLGYDGTFTAKRDDGKTAPAK